MGMGEKLGRESRAEGGLVPPSLFPLPGSSRPGGRSLQLEPANFRAEKSTRPAFFVKPRSTFKMPQKNLKKTFKFFQAPKSLESLQSGVRIA
jgi:hypothetical protein